MAVIVLGLVVALLFVMVISVGVGAVSISPDDVVNLVISRLFGTPEAGSLDFIVWELRVPRVLQAAVIGAALAVAGACAQILVRNPIADPYVLGLSSGAGVAAVAVITGVGVTTFGVLLLPVAAFLGAAVTGLLVAATATSRWGLSAGRLVLSGVAIGQLLAGVMSFLLIRAGNSDATQQVMFWLLGSLSGAQWRLFVIIAPVIIIAILFVTAISGRLDLMSLGDAQAAASGVHPGRSRFLVFALASLMTGAAVAVSGAIGFVGLIVPHIVRLLVGGMHRRVVPVAALVGAILLSLADVAARTLLAPSELPVGIFTAAIGVPVFILLMRRNSATVLA